MSEAYIKLEKVSKKFKQHTVLKPLTISFEKGMIHGIIGRNGSGKTVMLKLICGLLLPTSGTVTVNGKVIGRDVDFPQNIGIIIETTGFIPYLSAKQNLMNLAAIRKVAGKNEVDDVLETVGLEYVGKKKVGKFSLGMKQRLAIAQAIMEEPELIILDEPMNGLDKRGVEDIRQLLLDLKEKGTTILLASHNMEDIRYLCDKVYEMDAGVLTELEEC